MGFPLLINIASQNYNLRTMTSLLSSSTRILLRRQLCRTTPLSAACLGLSYGGLLVAPRPANFCPTPQLNNTSTLCNHQQRTFTATATMPGKYELLCLENPLLDIQGVG